MQADLDSLCYQPEIKLQPRTRYFLESDCEEC
jgi:alpha-L-rhamnosidase